MTVQEAVHQHGQHDEADRNVEPVPFRKKADRSKDNARNGRGYQQQ